VIRRFLLRMVAGSRHDGGLLGSDTLDGYTLYLLNEGHGRKTQSYTTKR
jgi:hypothetical protein